MYKYKVCVYAICKNEEAFIDRWYDSVKEADKIFVLDTGSSDNSVSRLKEKDKVIVKEVVIDPWRFDRARNMSLDMVDNDMDICICIDFDEVLLEGWREALEISWKDGMDRGAYVYNWSLDDDNRPIVSFYADKIHKRHGYKWIHPVHEVLSYDGIENKGIINGLVINHYPDRSKSRSSYLPLLELSVKEDPTDDRNFHYLGREYMYHKRWNEAIDTLICHLHLKRATWKAERAASMRFIGRSYANLKRYDEAFLWYKKAIKEEPNLRDGYVEIALLYNDLGYYNKVIYYTNKALKIKNKDMSYINEVFSFDSTIYDLRSIAFYYLGKYKAAFKNINIALSLNNDDERLLNNKRIIEKEL